MRAHFKSCIDSQLLRQYNLLTPSDYMVQEAPPVPAPQGKIFFVTLGQNKLVHDNFFLCEFF